MAPDREPLDPALEQLDADLRRDIRRLATQLGDALVRQVGTDLLDQVNARPQGLADIGESQHIVAGLQQRGHSAAAIAAIMGGNFIRVFGEAVG